MRIWKWPICVTVRINKGRGLPRSQHLRQWIINLELCWMRTAGIERSRLKTKAIAWAMQFQPSLNVWLRKSIFVGGTWVENQAVNSMTTVHSKAYIKGIKMSFDVLWSTYRNGGTYYRSFSFSPTSLGGSQCQSIYFLDLHTLKRCLKPPEGDFLVTVR